jgi:exodeoxyribonuclease VII large subunit
MYITEEVLTVSELTKRIKQTIEENFTQVIVIGEISNFKAHNSGHWYFNLKDSNSLVCCAMWQGYNNYVFFTPHDGMKVVVKGKITLYPPKGNYQIDVRSMKPAGVGELQASFELLKQKLAAEGLFKEEFKKPIPSFPKKIGVITAAGGAALHDIISIAKRRFPLIELFITHSKAQGSGAAQSVAECLNQLNAKEDIDLIIIARGGGSIEDLWAFNEELTARAIFNSRLPVITGIGHEIDFTIADFVADLRAPTPSAAIELATPEMSDFFAFINDFSYNSAQRLNEICGRLRNNINFVMDSYGFKIPADIVNRKSQQTDYLHYKLLQNIDRIYLQKENQFKLLHGSISSHDIQKQLRKGFVLVKQDNKYIARSSFFNDEKPAELKFFDAEISVRKYSKKN